MNENIVRSYMLANYWWCSSQQLNIYALKSVLESAQNLILIVPDNYGQIDEVKILNKDIRFIHHVSKTSSLKLMSYPYLHVKALYQRLSIINLQ